MPSLQQKITRHTKRQKIQFKEAEQASKPDSDMAEVLELSDDEFKTMINMLKVLMEEVDTMQVQISNVRKGMGTLRKNKKRNAGNQKHHNRNEECL